MHAGESPRGKRSRERDDGGMEISIETELLMQDSLKRICLGSPTGESKGAMGGGANSWYAATAKGRVDTGRGNKGRDHSRNRDEDEDGEYDKGSGGKVHSYTCNPLRRPRSQLDESIDHIIRKHRRMYETTPAQRNEFLGMQLMPVGPDPLQDKRILGNITPNKDVRRPSSSGSSGRLAWENRGAFNVHSNDSGCHTIVQRDVTETADDSYRDNSHYANDISHSGWVLCVDDPAADKEVPTPSFDVPFSGATSDDGSVPMES
jgi:hypothetical protein